MNTNALLAVALLASASALPQVAQAATAAPKFGDPVSVSDTVTIDPILDGRLRWEDVKAGAAVADAVTMRLRAGVEVKDKASHLSFLVETEGNLALDKRYNAFPGTFTAAQVGGSHQRRTQYATVADPEDIALNRIQVQYKDKGATITLGRQRINLDDERWVGSAGWRQNEQTFEAVRGEFNLAGVSLDATYADKVDTIYGNDSGARAGLEGKFWFLEGGVKKDKVASLKGFAYLLDYSPTPVFSTLANSSQTYGLRATANVALSKKLKLNMIGSFARQSNYGLNPSRYSANYGNGELSLDYKYLTAKAGIEVLGADAGASNATNRAVQTPLATLHKWNGWADLFLTTPNDGLVDNYYGAGIKLPMVKAVKGLNAQVVAHWYGSSINSIKYGREIDASLGFKTGPLGWLVKYADYRSEGPALLSGNVRNPNTKKFWLQTEFSF